jgi:transposase InsO family protein
LLRGQKPVFDWGPEQQEAFDFIRDFLLAGVHLAPARYDLPFHLATDASDDGKGGVLYQLPTVPLDQQHPHDPAVHSADKIAVISFYSKCWPEALRGRPPFYLEADALLWGMEKARFYALSSPFTLYTYSDHAPLRWIMKSDKGAVSAFIIEALSDLDVTHQYVPGRHMTVPDSCSRHPMLGPRRLSPVGLSHSIEELFHRLPSRLQRPERIQVYAGENSADLKRAIQKWRVSPGSATVLLPLTFKAPPQVDLAILIPKPESTPQVLAQYLVSTVPFAVLMPVDLVSQAYNPTLFKTDEPNAKDVRAAFKKSGTLTYLHSQMMWIIGNVPELNYPEMFAAALRTPAPLLEAFDTVILVDVPATLEDWISAQNNDDNFSDFFNSLPGAAVRSGLHIYAPDNSPPKILVPLSKRDLLVRRTHEAMFHLGSAKVNLALAQSYYWPTMASDCRKWLADCPGCELEKARRNEAHAMFSASPSTAPRSRLCMDFQGQGRAETGHCEALAIIDAAARYVVVIPLLDRSATNFIPKFLDEVVFKQGAPDVLHSDAAQEFLSEALELLTTAANIETTTTLGHNAAGNSLVEVFWRYWNRCMRILPDDLYNKWPELAARICFAYNTAPHSALGNVSPFEIYHGVPARNPFAPAIPPVDIDAAMPTADLEHPAAYAEAVKTSAAAFTVMAQRHSDFERQTTADRLNEVGRPRTYEIGQRVKVYVPPTHEQMLATGRRAKHLLAWRGPCEVIDQLSTTTFAMREISTRRRFERALVNILPYKATTAPQPPSFDPFYSAALNTGEFVAARGEPEGPFYIAKVTAVTNRRCHYGTLLRFDQP